jgi:hypothetical protein
MKALFAIAAVVASIAAAPTALGSSFTTENSASQNQVNAVNAARSDAVSGLITENSATQNRIQQTRTVTLVTSNAFDWADAGIGAGGALGGMLLLVGGSLLALRRRDRSAVAV